MGNKGLRRVSVSRSLWNSEEDFAATLVEWLKDLKWEVYQEVTTGRGDSRADIVAVQGRLVWVIETKLSFSLELLWQARSWQTFAHYVSVAVPTGTRGSKGARMMDYFCRQMGVGLLVGHMNGGYKEAAAGSFDEQVKPRLDRTAIVSYIRERLTERHKTFARAGNSHGLYYTPFKATCERVAAAVKKTPGITMKELIGSIETHYHTTSTARSSLAKWIEKGIVEGVRLKRDGRALKLYPTNENKK